MRQIKISLISPSPANARKTFDQAKLEELAASIRAHGILQPVSVRSRGDGYELVAGERRFRAAKLAGFTALPCLLLEVDDRQAHELGLVENLQREDLNALEEAQGFEALLKLRGCTQQELADSLGCSQAKIGNALRLLKLPAKPWRQWLISGEITERHAREIVRAVEAPKALADLAADIKDQLNPHHWRRGLSSAEQLAEDVDQALEQTTYPVEGTLWSNKAHKDIPLPAFTPEQLERLAVVTVGRGGKQEKRATNANLFEEIWDAHVESYAARKAKREDVRDKKHSAGTKKLSPAEAKKAAATKARQFRDRLDRWRTDWIRWLCGERVTRGDIHVDYACERLILLLASGIVHAGTMDSLRRDALRGALLAGPKPAHGAKALYGALGDTPDQFVGQVGLSFVRRLLVTGWAQAERCTNRPDAVPLLPPDVVEMFARELSIDVAAAWKGQHPSKDRPPGDENGKRQAFAGPLTEEYFRIHTGEQLAVLARGWGVYVKDGEPKSGLVKRLLAQQKVLPLPAEVKPVKAARAKPAKKSRAKAMKDQPRRRGDAEKGTVSR
ncbi:MAG TPA: ParB/RepB/Spo0J family partition protein [Pirellulales bacterium]|jgi:ParB/RepB/Spo0J family partition protein